jgi:hypothetical protein
MKCVSPVPEDWRTLGRHGSVRRNYIISTFGRTRVVNRGANSAVEVIDCTFKSLLSDDMCGGARPHPQFST